MSFRVWLSIITFILIGVILYASRKELVHAWQTLSEVNLWLLALVVPISAATYLASGEMIFSYLRQKRLVSHINPLTLMRISLELNFVNHVLPSGGASGVTYFNWRLGRLGVSTSKATIAQGVRYVAGVGATITLLLVSLIVVTADGHVNRAIILLSALLIIVMVLATVTMMYLLKSPTRLAKLSKWLARTGNLVVKRVTFGKKQNIINPAAIQKFFDDMHEDYVDLRRDKRLLVQPYVWGLIFTTIEIALFYVTFLALGVQVNPASILIAYSVASIAGFIVVTPGGAGAYETIMVMVLATAGIAQSSAIAGIVLARVLILLVTIVVGYIFYQEAIMRYGKRQSSAPERQ